MSHTASIAVRITPRLEEQIQELIRSRSDGVQVTRSQVLRAALEIGLEQMMQALKKEKSDG